VHLYRFHFLDVDGGVTRRHSVRLPTAVAATNLGHQMLAECSDCSALEVWHLNHLVHREGKSKAAA